MLAVVIVCYRCCSSELMDIKHVMPGLNPDRGKHQLECTYLRTVKLMAALHFATLCSTLLCSLCHPACDPYATAKSAFATVLFAMYVADQTYT